jgi:FlaA1/EpsC-like NDP-sugar epimerase
VRRLLSGREGMPRRVIVLSRDESKQHAMRLAWRRPDGQAAVPAPGAALEFRIGDVRDYHDVCAGLRDADVVVNAAALKQVPSCEYLPEQAVATNCMGTINIVRALREHGWPVEAVLGISTDKACKPVSVMGMTKALAERALVAANVLDSVTRYLVVRFGNVLASRGSVVPLFHHQIVQGGPVTVTAPEMTRFLLTGEQAADLALAALRDALPGETLVPHAPSATVMHLAQALVGDRDVEIVVTGARPAEKLHEILVSEEEALVTVSRGDHYAIRPMLPELDGDAPGEPPVLKGEYSSAEHVLSLPETAALLRANGLLPGQSARGRGLPPAPSYIPG